MADDRGQQEHTPLTPEEVSQHEFATAFRGYDPGEVRSFLERVSGRLRALEELGRGMRGRLAQVQTELRAAQARGGGGGGDAGAGEDAGAGAGDAAGSINVAALDEATLLDALGEQAAHILRSAHDAAAAVTTKANEEARRVVSSAEAEANRIKLQVESARSTRIREADAEAALIVAQAQEDSERLRAAATAQASGIVEDGRRRGREIVEEAQAVRERVLGDLMKRRRVAQVQIEQLRAGRERLLEAYRVVRRTLDDVTDELQRADAEARVAAEAAGRRLAGEPGRSLPTVPGSTGGSVPAGASGGGGGGGGGGGSSERGRTTGGAPSGGGAASASSPRSAAGSERSATGTPRRTFSPRPEPRADARPSREPTRARIGGVEASPPRPVAAPGRQMGSETVRILGRDEAPGGRRVAAPEDDAEDDPESEIGSPGDEVEAATDADEAMPAFPGMAADDQFDGLAQVVEAERELTAWTEVETRAVVIVETEVAPAATDEEEAEEGEAERGPEPVAAAAVEPEAVEPEAVEFEAVEPEAVEPDEAEPGDAVQREPEPEPERQPEREPAPERQRQPAPARVARPVEHEQPRRGRPDLDELFARIRSERADAVAKAHEVLRPHEHTEPASAAAAGNGHAAVAAPTTDGVTPIDDDDESALQRRDEAIDTVLDGMTRKLKRAMQDEQNELLDKLRSHRGRPTADALLRSPQLQADRFRTAALPFLTEAAGEGVAFYGGQAREAVTVADLAENLAFSIVGPLRRRLEAALAEGPLDDTGTVAEHVGSAYREWKSQRIEQVAGDHVVAAFSRGVLAGASPRSTWRWVVDDQGTPCPDCDDNVLAGGVPVDEPFPTGQLHPPAHTGCRCLLVPAP